MSWCHCFIVAVRVHVTICYHAKGYHGGHGLCLVTTGVSCSLLHRRVIASDVALTTEAGERDTKRHNTHDIEAQREMNFTTSRQHQPPLKHPAGTASPIHNNPPKSNLRTIFFYLSYFLSTSPASEPDPDLACWKVLSSFRFKRRSF